jgi:glycosyltransferase involved in cell wall biosynthesis
MRILNLIQCTNLGGMEQASLRLMRSLIQRGHECRVVSLNPLGALGPLLKDAGIPADGLLYKGKAGWRTFLDLRKRLQTEEADALIMTGHNLLAFLALGDWCAGRRVLAIHFHHTGTKPKWQWRLIYSVARERFKTITFPSDFVRTEAEQIAPGIREMTRTVRNPMKMPDPPDASSRLRLRDRLGLPPTVPMIGNAGWLIHRKRFDVFLQSAALVFQIERRAQFVVAGDGSERGALEMMARELGLSERVHWLGWQSDLREFYSGIDVLLFNSDWDAFPTTPLEAMSYGCPVVASAINSGLKEAITDDRFGVLYDTHDPQRLAAAVLAALTPAGAQMGLRGRERIAAMSNPEVIAGEIESLLAGDHTCQHLSP